MQPDSFRDGTPPRAPAPSLGARAVTALVAVVFSVLGNGATAAFDFEDVAKRAEANAQAPYLPSEKQPPKALAALTYDQYRDIRFRPDRALWRGDELPFETMFFHLGKFQTEPVLINEVAGSEVRHIRYRAGEFDYGKNKLSPLTWGDIGFAGFRVHYPLNSEAYKDEIVVFLGASYFRALGAGQRYGLSARGLAIDTVGGSGEEFPRFSEFWLVKPAPGATTCVKDVPVVPVVPSKKPRSSTPAPAPSS